MRESQLKTPAAAVPIEAQPNPDLHLQERCYARLSRLWLALSFLLVRW
jgi:hypothetical protein